jgi:hypothetical protein
MRQHQGGDVLALDPQTLSITATCFQYHGYGRRAGLKIRYSAVMVAQSQRGTIGKPPPVRTQCRSSALNARFHLLRRGSNELVALDTDDLNAPQLECVF